MDLEFKPSPYRSWQSREVQKDSSGSNVIVYVSGWISTENGILAGKDFADFILGKFQNNAYERLKENLISLFNNI